MSKIFKDAIDSLSPCTLEYGAIIFDIIDRINTLLKAKGMTEEDLAKLLGESEPASNIWACGDYDLTFRYIAKITVALGEPIIQVPNGRPRKLRDGSTKETPAADCPGAGRREKRKHNKGTRRLHKAIG